MTDVPVPSTLSVVEPVLFRPVNVTTCPGVLAKPAGVVLATICAFTVPVAVPPANCDVLEPTTEVHTAVLVVPVVEQMNKMLSVVSQQRSDAPLTFALPATLPFGLPALSFITGRPPPVVFEAEIFASGKTCC